MATERRLIDANELLDEMHRADERQKTDVWLTTDIEYLLAEQPAVDAVEVVHGRWEHIHEGVYLKARCTACGVNAVKVNTCVYDTSSMLVKWAYCPNCGAKMDGDVNG